MRTIKFRAWDKNKHEMLKEFTTTDFFSDSGMMYNSHDDCIFQQFTGLLDKNRKEIYEGDIVAENPRIIKDVPEHGDLDTAEVVEITYSQSGDGYGVEAIGYLTHWSEKEIIGNVYENPELIK